MLRYKFSLVALHFAVSGEGTIMDKSIGTHFHFCGVFQFTQVQPLPSPHKQCWTPVSRIFFRVSTLYRVGAGRTARNFRKGCTINSEQRNDRKVRILQYCPNDFYPGLQFCNKFAKQVGRKIALSDVAEKLVEILFLSRQCLSILMHWSCWSQFKTTNARSEHWVFVNVYHFSRREEANFQTLSV